MNPVALPIAEDHPSFAGHFPGRPLLPGVVVLGAVLEAALADPGLARALGGAPRLSMVKFLAPLGPGAALTVRFDATASAIRFEVTDGTRIAASGAFERSDVDRPGGASATGDSRGA